MQGRVWPGNEAVVSYALGRYHMYTIIMRQAERLLLNRVAVVVDLKNHLTKWDANPPNRLWS